MTSSGASGLAPSSTSKRRRNSSTPLLKSTWVTSESASKAARARSCLAESVRQQALFDGAFGDQHVHLHRLLLAHAVGPADALFEHRRVPRQIDVDHRVGRLKIQARRAGVGGDEQPAARIVLETVDQLLPLLLRHRAVQPHVIQLALARASARSGRAWWSIRRRAAPCGPARRTARRAILRGIPACSNSPASSSPPGTCCWPTCGTSTGPFAAAAGPFRRCTACGRSSTRCACGRRAVRSARRWAECGRSRWSAAATAGAPTRACGGSRIGRRFSRNWSRFL